jgi:hypothetical protein
VVAQKLDGGFVVEGVEKREESERVAGPGEIVEWRGADVTLGSAPRPALENCCPISARAALKILWRVLQVYSNAKDITAGEVVAVVNSRSPFTDAPFRIVRHGITHTTAPWTESV